MQYCPHVNKTKRWKTREVMVGNIGIGGDNPIRIQSMTTSDTRDAKATADQIMRLSDAGCEIARVTVQGKKEAEACEEIKNILLSKNYTIPLVADIHFYPPAAMLVADFVDKVRVNPGNYADKRATFQVLEYDDVAYQRELERIEEKFSPLVLKCKELGRAMRIGTNHGSLSDRIMNFYGDTPKGMVESALEYARVCRSHDYHNFVFSMKASNPQVMIQAYRLLVAAMMQLGWDYPLHIGVTEAGDGEDGRVKSATGMGSLLLDGLGDTVRVSLTEDPWYEIDPCKRLRALSERYQGKEVASFEDTRKIEPIERRRGEIGAPSFLHKDGTVVADYTAGDKVEAVDAIVIRDFLTDRKDLDYVQKLMRRGVALISPHPLPGAYPLKTLEEAAKESKLASSALKFSALPNTPTPHLVEVQKMQPTSWDALKGMPEAIVLFQPGEDPFHNSRRFFAWLAKEGLKNPVILSFKYDSSYEDLMIEAGTEFGSLLCDGMGDGVHIRAAHIGFEERRTLSFTILQCCRMRSTKTEFISCPSCGRTLFDLQSVTRKIRARTGHLKGVKIAIMGCIVNGPGEMADADFGYVGSGRGMIDLYVGKTRVEKNIPSEDAVERLVKLLKDHNAWVEAEQKVSVS